jgi:hypothetical protein
MSRVAPLLAATHSPLMWFRRVFTRVSKERRSMRPKDA